MNMDFADEHGSFNPCVYVCLSVWIRVNQCAVECPMCGEIMRLNVREVSERAPGTGVPQTRLAREWVCPECDYFEEAETGEG